MSIESASPPHPLVPSSPSACESHTDAPFTSYAQWLQLVLTPELGPVHIRTLLRRHGLPQDILGCDAQTLARDIGPARAQAVLAYNEARQVQIERNLAWSREPGNGLCALGDAHYPSRLLELPDPPPLLWFKGHAHWLNRPAVAVVGARHASLGGMRHARQFAQSLSAHGLVVISGMAKGIDACAHQGALQGGTIAIVGNGLDRVYPATNRELAHQIARTGLIVSEFELGVHPARCNFPRRNRLIAALSLGVLVIEAARESGSLITARQAVDLGRDVFALPGSIDSPLSKGCHDLIKQGAKLVDDVDDILTELALPLSSHQSVGPSAENAGPHQAALPTPAWFVELGWDPISVDELAAQGNLPIEELCADLTQLELVGCIERLIDGRIKRIAALE